MFAKENETIVKTRNTRESFSASQNKFEGADVVLLINTKDYEHFSYATNLGYDRFACRPVAVLHADYPCGGRCVLGGNRTLSKQLGSRKFDFSRDKRLAHQYFTNRQKDTMSIGKSCTVNRAKNHKILAQLCGKLF